MPDTIKPATPPPPWTPTPWTTDEEAYLGVDHLDSLEIYPVADVESRDTPVAYVHSWWKGPGDDAGADLTVANARRIVACVNALEGIDDPAAALAEVREAFAEYIRNVRPDGCFDPECSVCRRYNAIEGRALAALARLGG